MITPSLRNLMPALLLFLLVSCAHVNDDFGKGQDPEPTPDEYKFLQDGSKVPDVPKEESGSIDDGDRVTESKEVQEKLQSIAEKLVAKEPRAVGKTDAHPALSNKPAPRFYEDLVLLNGDEQIKVSIAFNSAPLLDAIPAFADALGFDFIADSDLRGTVTLNFNSHMTRRELFEAFDQMLYLAGAGAVKASDSYTIRIMPLSKMPAQRDLRAFSRGDGSSEVLHFSLRNMTAAEAQTQLKPFLGANSVILPLARQNAILISDSNSNIPKLRQLLEVMDQDVKSQWPRSLIYCRNIKPSKLVTELGTIMPVLGFSVAAGTASDLPGSIQLTGLDRLQVLVASAATQEAIDEIRQWIGILDSSANEEQEHVYVYKVSHSRADQLMQALAVIFNIQGTALTVSTSTTGVTQTQTQQITAQQTQAQSANSATNLAAFSNAMTNTQVDRNSTLFETPVRVFSDGVFNRLVIRTTPRTYALVKALLDKIDIVPSQVLLQVLVMEVSLTDSTEFGLEMSYTTGGGSVGSTIGTTYENLNRSKLLDPTGVSNQGGIFEIFNPNDPSEKFGKIKALAGNNNIKVVSSPQILVTSNTQAEIQVGQSVPTVQQAVTNTSSSSDNVTKNYIYEDVGVILQIMPQVTSTDLISLDMTQTISEADFSQNPDTPIIDKRVLKTTMTIANGRTMIIGGLIKERRIDNLSTLPFISEIPFLRRLLGSTDYSMQRTELLVLITGYIVNEKSPLDDMLKRYNEAVAGLNKFETRLETVREDERKKAADRARIQAEKLKKSPEVSTEKF